MVLTPAILKTAGVKPAEKMIDLESRLCATFINTGTRKRRAAAENAQKAAGHRDPSTTKLYDRQGYNSEGSPALPILLISEQAVNG